MREIPEDILQRARDGDWEAFEQIYKAASGFVYSLALRVIQNKADAEETTQDVFLKIHQRLGSFESRSSFKTWLYRVTVNTALNYCQKANRERNRRADYESIISTEQVPAEIENRIDQEDKERLVQTLLQKLNADQRACIVLREIEGLDYQQMADTLGLNINTVRSRLKRARESLMEVARKGVMNYEL